MRARVPLLDDWFSRGRGHRHVDPTILKLNLSFVLHEHSDSRAVRDVAAACQRHAARVARLRDEIVMPATVDGVVHGIIDRWMTASVGVPLSLVSRAIAEVFPGTSQAASAGPRLLVADSPLDASFDQATVPFFRAPAHVALPEEHHEGRFAVVGLVLRPDGRTTHLRVFGEHAWPVEREPIVRSLERLIQSYSDQWMPEIALWDGPAEILLPDEIR